MFHSGCQSEYLALIQIIRLILRVDAQGPFESMDRDSPIRGMFLHDRAVLHGDQHQAKIVRL